MGRGRRKYVRDVRKTCMVIADTNWEKLSEMAERNKMSRSDLVNALIENCDPGIRFQKQMRVISK